MIETILSRRSIRKYKPGQISENELNTILKSAMSAPTAGNSQCWEFIVINDRKLLDRIPEFHPYSQMLYNAPLAVLVCADLKKEKYPERWPLDCAAATENILLSAHSLKLGAVWVGIYPDEIRMNEISSLLNLPDNIKPVALIPIGYPDEKKPPSDRFDSNKIHFNKL